VHVIKAYRFSERTATHTLTLGKCQWSASCLGWFTTGTHWKLNKVSFLTDHSP